MLESLDAPHLQQQLQQRQQQQQQQQQIFHGQHELLLHLLLLLLLLLLLVVAPLQALASLRGGPPQDPLRGAPLLLDEESCMHLKKEIKGVLSPGGPPGGPPYTTKQGPVEFLVKRGRLQSSVGPHRLAAAAVAAAAAAGAAVAAAAGAAALSGGSAARNDSSKHLAAAAAAHLYTLSSKPSPSLREISPQQYG